jgi:hypothetical protein
MRTPGRCTNLEGCWIGATQRDVWLSIGEDFACPNCSGALTAPPRRSISVRGLKKAAVAGVTVTMGLAAMALAGVKLSTLHWAAQPTVVAGRHIAGSALASRTVDGHGFGMRVAEMAAPTASSLLVAKPTAPSPSVAASQMAASDSEERPSVTYVPAPGRSSPSVVVFTDAAAPRHDRQPDDDVAAPVNLVTLVSEADFVLPAESRRSVVLPITFGEPPHPEDLDAPVNLRWRFHGFVSTRQSYFLPAPGRDETLSKIIRTPGFLR